jgi:DNA polymerase III subunit delta'
MNFLGNKKAVLLLDKIIKKGQISQAYLFSGPENVGKFTLAKIFANSVIEDKNFHDLLDNTNKIIPFDCVIIGPKREEKKGIIKEKDISVAQIRQAQNDLALYPYSGKYKVLIIDSASLMSPGAQNALLKSLEEPNPTSLIILIAHSEKNILATITSRCQKIKFNLVEKGELLEEIKKIPEKFDENIVTLSLGKPGLLSIMKTDKEIFERRWKWQQIFENIVGQGINEKLKLAENFSKNVPESIQALELWIGLLRLRSLQNVEASRLEEFKTIKKIEDCLEILRDTNSNAKLVLEKLLIAI